MLNKTAEEHRISGDILFVGGGVAGMTAAIEVAETGKNVILVEKNPYIGGRVLQMSQYFPKLCPPTCGIEINFRRIRRNRKINVMTLSEVVNVTGQSGNFQVTIHQKPRYVNDRCTACNKCVEPCQATRPNDFNYGMDTTKAIYLPHEMSFPMQYVVDMEACRGKDCNACVEACPYDAIELDMKPKTYTADVRSIVWATGWKPFDAAQIEILGFGKYDNVVTSVMLERLASPNGPTKGKILRPSDGKEPKRVAFVQCVGSRDQNHLPYCSAVCCAASMKEASYIRSRYPDSEVSIFYIDVRSPGRLEDFYTKMKEDEKVKFQRGKVANITEDPNTKDLTIKAEDTLTSKVTEDKTDMVVLAVGIVPNTRDDLLPFKVPMDDYGFIIQNGNSTGFYGAGTSVRPMEVSASIRDGMSAALKALQTKKRNKI